ncbi:MAG: hypothetical protein GXO69_08390 [Acidobacteria bacterium]|nr:hypothetical protein [Acidobacteriota bacterium]
MKKLPVPSAVKSFVALMLLYSGIAGAQEIRSLALTRIHGAYILGWEGTSENERDNKETVRDYSESFFRYGLNLNLEGYIYHPNLLNFTIDGTLIQNRSSVREFENSFLYNEMDNAYDMRFRFLEKKPVHATLYFFQSNTSSDRAFLGRYYNRVKKHGITLFSKLGGIPFELDVNRMSNRYASLTFEDRNEKTDNITMKTTLYNRNGHRGMLNFRFKNYSESVYDVNYKQTQLQGIFESVFKTTRPTRYSGVFRYDKMAGASNLNTITLMNSIARELSPHLRATGMLNFSRTRVFDSSMDQSFVSAALTHSLFESLESEISLTARRETGDNSYLNRTTGHIQTAYRKIIPTGRLNLIFSQQYEVLANHSSGQTQNDSVEISFDFSNSIVLNVNGINPDSIIITDPQLSVLYQNGIDYQILVTDEIVYITRIPGGNIPEGGTVLVSYLFQQQPDYILNIHDYQNSFQLRFLKMFRIGYRIRGSGNRLDSRFLVSPFESYLSRQKMAGLDSKFFTWQYSTEKYDGTRSRYTTRNWQGATQVSFHRRFRLIYTLADNKTDFQSQEHFNEIKSRYLTFSWVLLSGLSGDINYRNLQYRSDNYDRRRASIFARFQWQIRRLLLTGSYEYILDDTDAARRRHSYYILSIRRRF